MVIKLWKDSNWEKRKKGLEMCEDLLEKGKIQNQVVMNEVIKTFLGRILDPHKQLQKLFIGKTLLIVNQLVNLKPYAKNLIINLVSILGDKNKELRELGRTQLEALENIVGLDLLMSLVQSYLCSDNLFIKQNVLELLLMHPCHFTPNSTKTLFILCSDKSKCIR